MLSLGTVRIGTAAEMQIPDEKDDGRGDPNEAMAIWRPGPSIISLHGDHPFAKFLGPKIPEGRKLDFIIEGDNTINVMTNFYILLRQP